MINGILQKTYFGNSLLDYLISLGILIICLVTVKIFQAVFLKALRKKAKTTKTSVDDFLGNILAKIVVPFLYLASLYVSINLLQLNPKLNKVFSVLATAIVTFFVAKLIIKLTTYGFGTYFRKRTANIALEHSLTGILKVIKFIIWALAIVFYLDNLGFKISTVIAGLGIGGVAIALAAQAILKDLFSYFSIIFDRPFEVGDFIITGDLLGTVEHIGIKTTRVRSLGGEELVFSNSDLTDSRLRNYKRMAKRRVVFKLGVTYNTPLSKLKELPKIIEDIIKNVENTTFDRAHFFSYGDFNLVFEIVYYVLSSDYNKYMDIQQEINFNVKEAFEKLGVEFAFPTQTVYLNK